MNLEEITVKIRPRKSWEAIDLGVSLVQRHAIKLYKIWFITTLPVFLLGSLLFMEYSIWPYFVFWFLKPIWERPLLHFLSRELFGEKLSVKECVKAFFSLAKIQWFASLTWRRLSFTRSLDLPLIQLEGLSGNSRNQRLKVIHSIGSSSAVWLTIIFVLLEIIFYFSFISLAYLLLPEPIKESFDLWSWLVFESDTTSANFLMNLLSYFSISIVAPFFTACGFALYLNHRTLLEAWDIELAFKRLAKRLSDMGQFSSRLASYILVFSFVGLLTMTYPVNAVEEKINTEVKSDVKSENKENIDETNLHQEAKQIIKKIKKQDVFNQKEKDYRYERIKEQEQEVYEGDNLFFRFIKFMVKIFSWIVEFALWVCLAVFLLFLIIKYKHLISGVEKLKVTKQSRPKEIFGLDISTESLPDKPWHIAEELIKNGKLREAVSLLYRASLIWTIDNTDVIILEGDTELQCLNKIAQKNDPSIVQYLSLLTDKWRNLAYAHVYPEIESVRLLCEQWPDIFSSKPEVES